MIRVRAESRLEAPLARRLRSLSTAARRPVRGAGFRQRMLRHVDRCLQRASPVIPALHCPVQSAEICRKIPHAGYCYRRDPGWRQRSRRHGRGARVQRLALVHHRRSSRYRMPRGSRSCPSSSDDDRARVAQAPRHRQSGAFGAPQGRRGTGSGDGCRCAGGHRAGAVSIHLRGRAFLGELGLDGAVRSVLGVLPMVDALRDCEVVVPPEAYHVAVAAGPKEVHAISTLGQLASVLAGRAPWPDPPPRTLHHNPERTSLTCVMSSGSRTHARPSRLRPRADTTC